LHHQSSVGRLSAEPVKGHGPRPETEVAVSMASLKNEQAVRNVFLRGLF
jgi:hypothetical protein